MDLGDIGSLFSSLFSNQGQMVAGTALSAYGAYQRGAATGAAGDYNAAMARNNAALSSQQGDFTANQVYQRGKRATALAAANYGASGVTMDGSPMDVLADSTRNVLSDTLMSRVPFANRSAGLLAEANLDSNNARNARTSSYFAVGDALAKGSLRLRSGGSYFNFSSSGDG